MTEGDKIFSKETVNDYEEYRRAVREGKEITPEELVTVAEMLGESPEWIKERAEKFHMPIGEYLICTTRRIGANKRRGIYKKTLKVI